jgi:hypothetical protein
VVQFDDLGAVEVRSSHLGEAHHQHRADREVRHDHAVAAAELGAKPVDVGVVETGRAYDRVHAVHRQPWDGHASGVGHGEVDDHLATGVGQRSQITGHRDAVPRLPDRLAVDGGDELQVGVEAHGDASGAPHLPAGSDYTHLDLRHARRR